MEEQEGRNSYRYSAVPRSIGALICGTIAGMLIPGGLQVGCSWYFPDERNAGTWGILLWGEHWAIRVAASWAAAIGAGFITGAIARRRGPVLAALAAIPSTLCWLAIILIGWTERVPFLAERYDVDVSIGNKLAATVLVFTIIPFAVWAGRFGEVFGDDSAEHFDARRGTLLGIKWFHYLWLPILIQVLIVQASWTFLYGFEWLRATWRAGIGLSSIIPGAFTMMIWGTLGIMLNGAEKSYMILSGLQPMSSARSRAFQILKYGFGALVLAAILQVGIALLHYGLGRLFGHGSPQTGG